MAALQFTNADAISGGVLAGLGGYILLEARQWSYMEGDGPGPAFFPTWYGIGLVVLSLFVIGARITQLWGARQGAVAAAPQPSTRDASGVVHALAVWAAFAVSIALLKVAGFLLAFGLLTFFIVAVIYRRSWKIALAVAAGSAVGFYLVFAIALGVPLPVGVLFSAS